MRIWAVIDRFEDDRAVLLVGEDERQVIWLRQDLPPETVEGDIVRFDIAFDGQATRQARAGAEELLRRLTGDK
jgi:hypothetical protein